MELTQSAHQAAWDAAKNSGRSWRGVNIVYPAVNRNLYENIIKMRGP